MIKVGGSLFDLADLGSRLQNWLESENPGQHRILFTPGGGPTTDVVRILEQVHQTGEESSHWLALRALTLNAHFLSCLLPKSQVVSHPNDVRLPGTPHILDPYLYCLQAGEKADLPAIEPSWKSGSDYLAAHAALAGGAKKLVLLKSVSWPDEKGLALAAGQGLVDQAMPGILAESPALPVKIICLR